MNFSRDRWFPKEIGLKIVQVFIGTGTGFEFYSDGSKIRLQYNSSDDLLVQHAMQKAGYRDSNDPNDR